LLFSKIYMKIITAGKSLYLLLCVLTGLLFISADRMFSSGPPAGYTGENGSNATCKSCHNAAVLNPSGTSVVISGLPDTYVPGTTYTLTLTVNNPSISGSKWGFAMKPSAGGTIAGAFSNLPAGTELNSGGELTHAQTLSAGPVSTINNIRWTAPVTPTVSEQTITFHVAALSGSFSGAVITGSKTTTLQSTSVREKNTIVSSWSVFKSGNNLDVRMKLSKPTKLQLMLYTLDGKKVMEQGGMQMSVGEQQLQMATKNLASGTYLIVLQDEKGKQTKKVVL